jgi:hypothetical protein
VIFRIRTGAFAASVWSLVATLVLTAAFALVERAAAASASSTPRPTVRFFSDEPLVPAEDLTLIRVGPGVHDPVGDGRSVWLPHELGVTRFDAMTGAPIQTFSVGANASVAVDGKSAWIASYSRDIVVPVDPATGEVQEARAVRVEAPGALALGFGSLWVLSPGLGRLTRIDANDGHIVATIDVDTWGPMVVGPEAVWLSSEPAGGLLRVDPETNEAQPIDVGVERQERRSGSRRTPGSSSDTTR